MCSHHYDSCLALAPLAQEATSVGTWAQVMLHPIVNTCYIITAPMGAGETVEEIYVKKVSVHVGLNLRGHLMCEYVGSAGS